MPSSASNAPQGDNFDHLWGEDDDRICGGCGARLRLFPLDLLCPVCAAEEGDDHQGAEVF
jgi:predicted amidophosphoribosyltransferase